MYKKCLFLLPIAMLVLGACKKNDDMPVAITPDRDAITYFGRMVLLDHRGPRGQIHLKDGHILWFPSARDLLMYHFSPEEDSPIDVLYVSDMSKSASWKDPNRWIQAKDALYVIESRCQGGMGARETVPFSKHHDAKDFIKRYGGKIVKFDEIAQSDVMSAETLTTDFVSCQTAYGEGEEDPHAGMHDEEESTHSSDSDHGGHSDH